MTTDPYVCSKIVTELVHECVQHAPRCCSYVREVAVACGDTLHCQVPEFGQKGIMCQKADVFGVIIGFVLPLCLLFGLPGVYAFENAQTPAQRKNSSRWCASQHGNVLYVSGARAVHLHRFGNFYDSSRAGSLPEN